MKNLSKILFIFIMFFMVQIGFIACSGGGGDVAIEESNSSSSISSDTDESAENDTTTEPDETDESALSEDSNNTSEGVDVVAEVERYDTHLIEKLYSTSYGIYSYQGDDVYYIETTSYLYLTENSFLKCSTNVHRYLWDENNPDDGPIDHISDQCTVGTKEISYLNSTEFYMNLEALTRVADWDTSDGNGPKKSNPISCHGLVNIARLEDGYIDKLCYSHYGYNDTDISTLELEPDENVSIFSKYDEILEMLE